jgi:NADH-quinone oxidoreductase subunit E
MKNLLKPETYQNCLALLTQYPTRLSAMLPLLHLVQEDRGYICKDAIAWIAEILEVEPIRVYEVVTFYPMFREAPIGKKHIKVCRTLSCALAGSYTLSDKLKQILGCAQGATSPDGEYTIEFVECLANCSKAPTVMVDEQLHDCVHPEKAEEWLQETFPNLKGHVHG